MVPQTVRPVLQYLMVNAAVRERHHRTAKCRNFRSRLDYTDLFQSSNRPITRGSVIPYR